MAIGNIYALGDVAGVKDKTLLATADVATCKAGYVCNVHNKQPSESFA